MIHVQMKAKDGILAMQKIRQGCIPPAIKQWIWSESPTLVILRGSAPMWAAFHVTLGTDSFSSGMLPFMHWRCKSWGCE